MTRVTLRLPDEVHKQLKANARASGTSLNQTIVNVLAGALGCGKEPRPGETPLQVERRRIREALGDLVVEFTEEDFAFLKPLPADFDREALFQSLAGVNLSGAIIEEREESRY